MNTVPQPSDFPRHHASGTTDIGASRLSALLDGELAADELGSLFSDSGDSNELHATWARYQVIGETLRGSHGVLSQQASQAFLAGVHAKLHGAFADPQSANVASPPGGAVVRVVSKEGSAANDPVFRWKLVAGLASMAAVMAISWTVLGSYSPGSGGGGQLALAQSVPAQTSPVAVGAAPASVETGPSVVINTDRGPLIRDARLEALMAEHRHGGVSALQMPAGFLRNATYEDAGR